MAEAAVGEGRYGNRHFGIGEEADSERERR